MSEPIIGQKISQMPLGEASAEAVVPVVYGGANYKVPLSLLKGEPGTDGSDGENGAPGVDAPRRPGWYNGLTAPILDVPTTLARYLRLAVPASEMKPVTHEVKFNFMWRANTTNGAFIVRVSSPTGAFTTLDWEIEEPDSDNIQTQSYTFYLPGDTPIELLLEARSTSNNGVDLIHANFSVTQLPEMVRVNTPA